MGYESTLELVVLGAAWLFLVMLLLVAAVDVVLGLFQVPSVGRRIQRWARHYPAFAAALIFLYGALMGHFFTQG